MKLAFDVYLDKVDPVTPMFTEGKKNGSIQLTEGCEAFYEQTGDKNGLELEIDIKKHNKNQFFEAVESQLMYMPDIKFMHKRQGSLTYQEIDIAAKELYRDDNVVISESTVYDKPHILLGAGKALVNYGFVAFNELEIEPKRGAVGLILDINDIEVTPSREAPIWSPKTREAVLQKYSDVSKKAAEYINKELSEEKDYLEWIVKAAQTMSALKHGNNDSVVGRLASIIDASAITDIKFPRDNSIEYSPKILHMMGDKLVARVVSYTSWQKKVERTNVNDLSSFSRPVYFTKDKADMYVDRYLYENEGEFILIQAKEGYKQDTFAKYVLNSQKIQDYSKVEVPEDLLELYKAADDSSEMTDSAAGISSNADNAKAVAIRRKLESKIVLHELNHSNNDYVFSSKEVAILDLATKFQADKTVIYGSGNDRSDLKALAKIFPANYMNCYEHRSRNGADEDDIAYKVIYDASKTIEMVLTSEDNKKHLSISSKYKEPFSFVVKSYNKRTGKLVFSDDIKAAATAAVLDNLISGSYAMKFAHENMEEIDKPIHDFHKKLHAGWISRSRRPLKMANRQEFYRECIELAMIKEGFLGGDTKELIEEINDLVPGILCDKIDYITEVDILYTDLIEKVLTNIDKYKDISELVTLYCDKYYYNAKDKQAVANQLSNIMNQLNPVEDDEIVQQSDNTGGEGQDG